MEDILKDKLGHYTTGSHLGIKQKRQIMREAWKQQQRKIGKEGLSRQDIKDFSKIVDTIIDDNR